LHAEWAIKAAQRGLHVLSEKPMALTVEDADSIIEAVEEAGVKYMVAHCTRFSAQYIHLKNVVESGELGALKSISMRRSGAVPLWSWDGWLLDQKRSGSFMVDLMIHDIDFLQMIAGKPLDVRALGFHKDDMWAHATALFNCPEGISASVEGSWGLPESYPFVFGFVAVFEEGAADYNLNRDPDFIVYKGQDVRHPKFEAPDLPKTDLGGNVMLIPCYLDEIAYFLDCVRKDKDPDMVPAKESRDALAVCLAMVKSVETDKIVEIPAD